MTKRKAVFLDRDGTIIEDMGYLASVDQVRWLPDVGRCLQALAQQGYLLVVVSNQSGVARGYYQEKDVARVNSYLQEELRADCDIAIDAFYCCPHHPQATLSAYRRRCACRKPNAAMFRQAITDLGIAVDQSVAIGDQVRDLVPARQVGVSQLFLLDRGRTHRDNTRQHFIVTHSWPEILRSLGIQIAPTGGWSKH